MAGSLRKFIAVVDDDHLVGEVIAMTLEAGGYDTKLFTSPQKFLAELSTLDPKPDLLVTDYLMPGINGLELIQLTKSRMPEMKTISVSGTLGPEVDQYHHRPDASLPKPFRQSELLDVVKQALDRD